MLYLITWRIRRPCVLHRYVISCLFAFQALANGRKTRKMPPERISGNIVAKHLPVKGEGKRSVYRRGAVRSDAYEYGSIILIHRHRIVTLRAHSFDSATAIISRETRRHSNASLSARIAARHSSVYLRTSTRVNARDIFVESSLDIPIVVQVARRALIMRLFLQSRR